MCVAILVFSLSHPQLANAQTTLASRHPLSTLSKEPLMSTVSTIDAPTISPASYAAVEEGAIRPFSVHVSEADVTDMRRRLVATRWPDKETVPDASQGAQLAMLQDLVHYWGTGYDWRKAEAKLNAYPQFVTTIDGVDIHFIHVKSRHPNALPLIITHGWPGLRAAFKPVR